MAFGSRTVAQRDVEFRINNSQFEQDAQKSVQIYGRTTGAMSDDALRMAIAQEKLTKTVIKFGGESTQAKQATLAYRREVTQMAAAQDLGIRSTGAATTAVGRQERALFRMSRQAIRSSSSLRGLGGASTFAASTFLGNNGTIYALTSTAEAASQAAGSGSKLGRVLGRAGIAGEAGYASFALTTLILKLTGADKAAMKLGADLYDVFGKGAPSTADAVSQKQAVTISRQVKKLARSGRSDDAILSEIQAEYPSVNPRDVGIVVRNALRPGERPAPSAAAPRSSETPPTKTPRHDSPAARHVTVAQSGRERAALTHPSVIAAASVAPSIAALAIRSADITVNRATLHLDGLTTAREAISQTRAAKVEAARGQASALLVRSQALNVTYGLVGPPKPAAASPNQREVMLALAEIQRRFAPNHETPHAGKAVTHMYEAVHELRQIKEHLAKASARSSFPATDSSLARAAAIS